MPSLARSRSAAVLASLAAGLLAQAAAGQTRPYLDIQLFARVGEPGQPEGIAVADDGTVYVGTHTSVSGGAGPPSQIFRYAADGTLLGSQTITGQDTGATHGLLAMAFDGDGFLYVLDRNPARLLRIDPALGTQHTYATFDDVAPCALGGTPGHCSAGTIDGAVFPDYLVLAPDGTIYVTDLQQALLWRVPRGGGPGEVWFTSAVLEGEFGPNGIQFMADDTTLLFAMTGSQPPGTTDPGNGVLYTLPVLPDGSPGALQTFWVGNPVDGPDGFAIAASGNVYVALAGVNQLLVLSPTGAEIARVPATPADNALLEVPFDMPGSVAFSGQSVLVTNHSFFTANPQSWAVLDVFAGETGLPLHQPLPEPGAALGLAAGALLLARLRRRAH